MTRRKKRSKVLAEILKKRFVQKHMEETKPLSYRKSRKLVKEELGAKIQATFLLTEPETHNQLFEVDRQIWQVSPKGRAQLWDVLFRR